MHGYVSCGFDTSMMSGRVVGRVSFDTTIVYDAAGTARDVLDGQYEVMGHVIVGLDVGVSWITLGCFGPYMYRSAPITARHWRSTLECDWKRAWRSATLARYIGNIASNPWEHDPDILTPRFAISTNGVVVYKFI